jgi:hypothetical protein
MQDRLRILNRATAKGYGVKTKETLGTFEMIEL